MRFAAPLAVRVTPRRRGGGEPTDAGKIESRFPRGSALHNVLKFINVPRQHRADISRVALPYRPDIDGLRATAVMAVVLFHSS